MRVYLAAPWVDRVKASALATQIEEAGHTITHRWWDVEDTPGTYPSNVDDPYYEDCAIDDFQGVVTADVVVVLNSCKSEGKAAETGIAIALLKPVVVIGVRSHIFHYLPNVQMVESAEEALGRLEC